MSLVIVDNDGRTTTSNEYFVRILHSVVPVTVGKSLKTHARTLNYIYIYIHIHINSQKMTL